MARRALAMCLAEGSADQQLLPLTLTTEEMVERINEEAAVNQELLAG